MPYKNNKDRLAWQKQKYDDTVSKLTALKENTPCADCGNKFPHYVMEFDHARGEKKNNISSMKAKRFDNVSLQAELEKCDLVCANCHNTRTYFRRLKGSGPEGSSPLISGKAQHL
jgi:hypothetical protein